MADCASIVAVFAAPWCSGLTRLPVKEEIGSSNLLGVAILLTSLPADST